MEIERKWLVTEVPAVLDGCPSRVIRQGYLALEPGGTEVRVRDDDGRRSLTVKSAGGLSREEVDIPLSDEQFAQLWPLTEGRRVEKRRICLRLDDGALAEVDVFEGALKGLVLAEVEFDSEGAAARFEPPAWMGREVTDDPRYKNRNLATAPPEQIRSRGLS
jgi:adenylate cyclase